MKQLKKVSRWIAVKYNYNPSEKNSLYYYAKDENGNSANSESFERETAFLEYFRFSGKTYALEQFINRFSCWGFDQCCNEYPSFIVGYDSEGDIYNPLLLEMDETGEKIRLWEEV